MPDVPRALSQGGIRFSSKKYKTSTACSNLPTPSSTRHRHPHPSSHLFFPPLHSLNPLRLQVSNGLMLPPTLALSATFLLSSPSNWRVSMSFVKYTAARGWKSGKVYEAQARYLLCAQLSAGGLIDVRLPSIDHSTFYETF